MPIVEPHEHKTRLTPGVYAVILASYTDTSTG